MEIRIGKFLPFVPSNGEETEINFTRGSFTRSRQSMCKIKPRERVLLKFVV
jgi:hypothetical protein